MKFQAKERIVLLGILPQEGDLRTMRAIMKLREALFFSEEEVERLQLTLSENRTHWDSSGDVAVDIPVGKLAREVIEERLKELDKTKKLTPETMDLWQMFFGEDEGEVTPAAATG